MVALINDNHEVEILYPYELNVSQMSSVESQITKDHSSQDVNEIIHHIDLLVTSHALKESTIFPLEFLRVQSLERQEANEDPH